MSPGHVDDNDKIEYILLVCAAIGNMSTTTALRGLNRRVYYYTALCLLQQIIGETLVILWMSPPENVFEKSPCLWSPFLRSCPSDSRPLAVHWFLTCVEEVNAQHQSGENVQS